MLKLKSVKVAIPLLKTMSQYLNSAKMDFRLRTIYYMYINDEINYDSILAFIFTFCISIVFVIFAFVGHL